MKAFLYFSKGYWNKSFFFSFLSYWGPKPEKNPTNLHEQTTHQEVKVPLTQNRLCPIQRSFVSRSLNQTEFACSRPSSPPHTNLNHVEHGGGMGFFDQVRDPIEHVWISFSHFRLKWIFRFLDLMRKMKIPQNVLLKYILLQFKRTTYVGYIQQATIIFNCQIQKN